MLDHIYASVNKALEKVWAEIAPGVPIVFGHPIHPQTLPAECLRLFWLDYGGETAQANETHSLVQLDVFTPGGRVALALRRAKALSDALHLNANAGHGRVGVFDGDTLIGVARLTPLERGWVDGADDAKTTPDVLALQRTIQVYSTPLAR
jgi:hypothetical protein